MREQLLVEVVGRLAVREPVIEIVSETEGASVWRVRGSSTDVAVKVFAVDATNRQQLEARVDVQRLAAAGGVRTPALVDIERRTGLWSAPELPEAAALVTQWVDGPPPSRCVDAHSAQELGDQLGRLHSLRVPVAVIPDLADDSPRPLDVLLAGLPADHSRAGQIAVELVTREGLPTPSIIGHRDLDWKNVIFTDQGAVVLDWAQAGPVDPSAELAGATVEWSGLRYGDPDLAAGRGLLRAYHRAGGIGTIDGIASFASWVLEELTWLVECAEAPSQHASELEWFARHFERVLNELPTWAGSLRQRPNDT